MPSRMALTGYTTPTSVSFPYSPLMSAMTCSAGQHSAGSDCRDDETGSGRSVPGRCATTPARQRLLRDARNVSGGEVSLSCKASARTSYRLDCRDCAGGAKERDEYEVTLRQRKT